jgi:tetratricopeptide (TPR) repeat protein
MSAEREGPRGQLAWQFAALAVQRGSGVVTASRGKLKRLFGFSDGSLVYGASNLLEEQFAALLVERRLLNAATRLRAEEEAKAAGLALAPHLLASGLLPQEVLSTTLEQHVRWLVAATLEWRSGEVKVASGRPAVDRELTVQLDPVVVIADAARARSGAAEAWRRQIGGTAWRPLCVAERSPLIARLGLGELGDYLARRCDGSLSLSEVIGRAPGGAAPALQAIYALALLGALQPAADQRRVERSAVNEAVTVDEVMARLKRAEDADAYAVLELNPTATRDDVREAYYFLARRYHPDRFRSGPLENLLAGIEGYFSKVTEAYNTLHDTGLRAAFDLQRTEAKPTVKAEPEMDRSTLAAQNFARAKLLIGRGRYTDAVTFLENAVELDGLRAVYHMTLGELLIRNPRRRDDAERFLREAIRLEPTRPEAYLALAGLCEKTERLEQAVEMYQEALRWDPDEVEAQEALRRLGSSQASGGLLRGLFKG